MKLNLAPSELLLGAVIVGGLAVAAWQVLGGGATAAVDVKVPALSPTAAAGKLAYDANCAACHGANGRGTDKGPPFVNDIYNPGHHSDVAFAYAVRRGVQQHHWSFGNMPPQPQVNDEQVAQIVAYVRELQRANGIVYRPHQM
jgi:mono/diheme cytochrome c family protein